MKKGQIVFLGIVLIVIGWSVFLYTHDIQVFVEALGAKNGYLIMFLVALFGGVSSLGGVTYVTTLITLSSGGLDPLLLALASGLGVSFGDTVYFYLGKKGLRKYIVEYNATHPQIKKWVEKLTHWLEGKPKVITFLGIYCITAFTPMPNDIIAITFGLVNKRYLTVVPALVLGNITHTFLIATFGRVLFFL
jgi:membrane protein DedA with SNARE-associated domain